ncbi:hypothetical protein BC833DRAFT_621174, partial [Globomyces pollinis-pini]
TEVVAEITTTKETEVVVETTEEVVVETTTTEETEVVVETTETVEIVESSVETTEITETVTTEEVVVESSTTKETAVVVESTETAVITETVELIEKQVDVLLPVDVVEAIISSAEDEESLRLQTLEQSKLVNETKVIEADKLPVDVSEAIAHKAEDDEAARLQGKDIEIVTEKVSQPSSGYVSSIYNYAASYVRKTPVNEVPEVASTKVSDTVVEVESDGSLIDEKEVLEAKAKADAIAIEIPELNAPEQDLADLKDSIVPSAASAAYQGIAMDTSKTPVTTESNVSNLELVKPAEEDPMCKPQGNAKKCIIL